MLVEAGLTALAGETGPYRPKPQVPRPRAPGPVKFRNAALHEWKYVVAGRPQAWPEAMLSRPEVMERLDRLPMAASASTRQRRAQGTTLMLDWLESWPGHTWQERWVASAADTAGAQWNEPLIAALGAERPPEYQETRVLATMGISQLLLRLIRPGYPWLYAQKLSRFWEQARQAFDPQGFARLTTCLEQTGRWCGRDQAIAFCQLARMLVRNGGTLAVVTVADCLEADAAMRAARESRCAGLYYDLLFEAGFLPPGSPPSIRAAKRRPLTVEELVDGYGIECTPVRDLFVGYLRERQGALDYSSLRCLVNYLVLNFWKDLEAHHPQISSLHLTPAMAADWKERLKYVRHGTNSTGTVRKDPAAVILAVRAFYSDIAHWALEEPARWGPWAAPNPIRPADTAIQAKVRRQQTARMHQRTRELAPALPKLMAAVCDRRRAAGRRLAAALAAGDGQQFEAGGRLVRHVAKADLLPGAGQGSRRVYATDPATGKRRDLTFEEDDAFWAWAVTEVLRHTGIRMEEMLELTHHSFTAYRLPGTGELIPLLQIAPSKTDRERLLVVSPELAEVLTTIIFRVRGDRQALPLTPRYDVRERLTSPPMPYLMQRRHGSRWRVISDGHVQTMLERALAASGLCDAGGKPLRYTPHDFRRIFATEAVAAGLPLPILAKLMGHQNVVTTQGYAAIYPQDVIQHHRAFIGRRRELRPSAEYRQPTDAEWEEFLGHFERRKVELGVCARAYGSPCQHEHACLTEMILKGPLGPEDSLLTEGDPEESCVAAASGVSPVVSRACGAARLACAGVRRFHRG